VTRALATLESACVVLARSRRVVKLYTGPAFARSWPVKHLGDFYDQHPDIDVEINATKASCEYVRSGDADIAICYGTPPDWPGLLHTEIVRSEVFPVCSPKYLHASDLGDTPDALVSETLLRTPKQPWTPWFMAAGLDAREPDHGPFFSDAALMLDAAAQGQGIALARKVLVEHELAAHRLVRVSSIGIQAEFSYCAVYNPLAALRDEVAVFIDWIEACSEIRRSAPRVADLSAHSAL
jgi:LysR family glycine cleavage system transcriptional activator